MTFHSQYTLTEERFHGITHGIGAALAIAGLVVLIVIQPIVQANCIACHGSNSPIYEEWNLDREALTKQNTGPRLDTYAYFMRHVVWPATGSIMRRLDDGKAAPGGKPGNMYRFLAATDTERDKNLRAIKVWLGEGAWNQNRWSTRDNVPGITKEQFDKVRAKF